MSFTENIVPDWVWQRRYSARLNKIGIIIVGLFFGILSFVVIIAAFSVRTNIEDVCTSYIGCSGVYNPGSPLGNALSLLELVTAFAAAIAAGRQAYALAAWRAKPPEWTASFGPKPSPGVYRNCTPRGS